MQHWAILEFKFIVIGELNLSHNFLSCFLFCSFLSVLQFFALTSRLEVS